MLYIIKTEPLENNFHPFESQSNRTKCWMDGYIAVPPNLVEKVVATGGYCDLIIEGGVLVGVTPTEKHGPDPVTEPDPTTDDILNALLGVTE